MQKLLFQNKYRINSIRLPGWDYGAEGCYFITICTKNRRHYFGKIINHKMHLSHIGEIVREQWFKSAQIRDNIILDEFIIMPDHLHGIIIIKNKNKNEPMELCNIIKNYYTNKIPVETPRRGVSTIPTKCGGKNINWRPNSIGSIICQFKSICSKKIIKLNYEFAWQSRYYDSIIKNENHLYRVREYIINNPAKWEININKFKN